MRAARVAAVVIPGGSPEAPGAAPEPWGRWAEQNRAWLRDLAPGSRVAVLRAADPGSPPEGGCLLEVGAAAGGGTGGGIAAEAGTASPAGAPERGWPGPAWEAVGPGFPWGRADVAFVAAAAVWATVEGAGAAGGSEFRRLLRAGRVAVYVLAPPERLRSQGFDEALTRLGIPFPGACAG